MYDDHDEHAIVLTEYGVFLRVRRNVPARELECPLCGSTMYRLRKPPVRPKCPPHALWLYNRVKFYACPDRDQPGHRAQEIDFRAAHEFWSQPLAELMAMEPARLLRVHDINEALP